MKDKLELMISIQELADNKLSKHYDHDIASQIIDSARDQGETLDLENLLTELVGVFAHDVEEAEPTLQAVMLATTTRIEYQDSRGSLDASEASRPATHSN
jgi:hypothetical protein